MVSCQNRPLDSIFLLFRCKLIVVSTLECEIPKLHVCNAYGFNIMPAISTTGATDSRMGVGVGVGLGVAMGSKWSDSEVCYSCHVPVALMRKEERETKWTLKTYFGGV